MASSHDPFAIYTLLRLTNTSSGMAGLRDNAVEYRVMASSCCWASAAMSPNCSSFSAQRCLKSEGDQSHDAACVIAQALTYSPFRLFTMRAMRVSLPFQFAVHLMETLYCVRYAVGHFEMIAESAINCESRGCKLQTKGCQAQGASERKEILTLRAETKASLHERPVNVDFAHALKSGVGDDESKVVSTLLLGVDRHRCKKSVTKCRMHSGGKA